MKKKNERGFTMIETALLIVIVGILSLAAIPSMTSAIENIRLNGAAQKMMSDLRYIREMAMSRHGTYGAKFEAGNNRYNLFYWNGVSEVGVNDADRPQDTAVDFDDRPEWKGVSISSVSACTGICTNQEVRITSFGVPQDEANSVFTSAATITLTVGSTSRTIQVTPQTAFVELV